QSRWRILHRSAALSTVYLKKVKLRFLQYFQTVALPESPRLSGVPLEGDAHSTDTRRTVNGVFELTLKVLGFHL
ncbi:hypothetical protein, partial [Marinobacter aromaticivorans]